MAPAARGATQTLSCALCATPQPTFVTTEYETVSCDLCQNQSETCLFDGFLCARRHACVAMDTWSKFWRISAAPCKMVDFGTGRQDAYAALGPAVAWYESLAAPKDLVVFEDDLDPRRGHMFHTHELLDGLADHVLAWLRRHAAGRGGDAAAVASAAASAAPARIALPAAPASRDEARRRAWGLS